MDRRQFLTGTAAVLTPAIAGCGGGDGGNGNGNGNGGNGNGNGNGGNGDTMAPTEEPGTTDDVSMTTEPATTTDESGTTTDDPATAEPLPSSVTVDMANTAFAPVVAEVAVGGTVEWVNQDGYNHDVTSAQFSDGAASWDYRAVLGADESTSYTFDSAGVYEYYCTIHGQGNMCGVVVVGDTSYDGSLPCRSGDDGGDDGPY